MDAPKAGLKQRLLAWALARFNHNYERFAAQYKRRLFADASGTVLEIGPGTGVNLHYLDRSRVRWIGVEPNPFMQPYLLSEAGRVGIKIDVRIGTADSLPLEDRSVDLVISTLVLCCVPDPQRCLREILRVLKPGGRFAFIEHVAAPRGSRLRRTQHLLAPFWSLLGDGCQPDRETWADLESAGFREIGYERISAPIPVVSPQIVGVAVKPAA